VDVARRRRDGSFKRSADFLLDPALEHPARPLVDPPAELVALQDEACDERRVARIAAPEAVLVRP